MGGVLYYCFPEFVKIQNKVQKCTIVFFVPMLAALGIAVTSSVLRKSEGVRAFGAVWFGFGQSSIKHSISRM